MDLVLQVEIVDLATEHQGQQCGICNEEFIAQTCHQSKENGGIPFVSSVHHVQGCGCSISEREYDADTGRSSILRLPCGHSYHQPCILPWFTNHSTCPYCRTPIIPITSVPTAEDLTARFDEEQLTRKIVFAMVQDAKNDDHYGRINKSASRANFVLNAAAPPPPLLPPRDVHATHFTPQDSAVKEDDCRCANHTTTTTFISHKTSLTTMRADLAQMLHHSLNRLLAKGAPIPRNR